MKNFDFLAKKNISFIITAVLLVAGLVSFIAIGFNMGVDFTGGSKITVQLKDKPDSAAIDAIETIVKDEVGAENFVSVINSTANPKTVIITIKTIESFDKLIREEIASLYGVEADDLGDKNLATDSKGVEYASLTFKTSATVSEDDVKAKLNALDTDAKNGVFKDLSADAEKGTVTVEFFSASAEQKIVDKIGESYTVSSDEVSAISKNRAAAQTRTALIAAAVAIVLMLVYITFRFKQIASGLASVLCLFFNLFIMFTFYAIFQWELTLDIIPACLTILGYSINATIVIFDRIRENHAKDNSSFDASANSGVHSTLLRSVNTTVTTLITIVLVYILGVESIKAFALPLIIGIVAGLFSSVFLSAPIWAVLRKTFGSKEKAAKAQ